MLPAGRITDVDQPAPEAPIRDEATLAISVLNALRRPLAILGADGQLLFSNPVFAAQFGQLEDAAALRERIDKPSATGTCGHITGADGRTFSLEIAPLPQGRLVILNEVANAGGSDALASKTAQIDPITQIGNRQMFRERLMTMLANGSGEVEPAAVMLINLARFKAINDSLGHIVGDKLLRVVADRIRSALGPDGFAARLRGEEFAVIQPCESVRSVVAVAERLIDLLGRSYILDSHLLTIGASIGVAMIPVDGLTAEQIQRNANLALQHAKLVGPGCCRFFVSAMDEAVQERRSLEIDLRRALALQELALVYQPQYNVATKRITGFETLLRWHHPKRGNVPPAEFIPIAEELGLIVPIGEWVIRRACCDATSWPEPLSVAVNISAVQFRSPDLAETILSGMTEAGLEPERLELEITESTLLGDRDAAGELLHKMRGLGVHIAMDDFGTGYSSLSYLRSFPFNKIKIDQSFVHAQPEGSTSDAIVRAIATLGESLGMTTIAEGVETEEQLARITADGCTDAQGYLISKPLAADKVEAFIRQPTVFAERVSAA